MCGIAGRILQGYGAVGNDLVELMDAQAHRGADSTGFAIYSELCETGYKLRLIGFSRPHLDSDLDDFAHILRAHGADYLAEPVIDDSPDRHYSVRLLISEPTDLSHWIQDADLISDRIEVQSLGKSLEIIKDVGDAQMVADKHGVRELAGTHGLGHARLATESSVLPTASHPFWARPFPDVAIVHNGQITDYYSWRKRLQQQGYRFMTENDSELIAVWVSDQMNKGLSREEALNKSISAIDGVFTFMISDNHGIGFAKDRFAMKPLVTVEDGGELAAATEEQAVRRVVRDECHVVNYDGPSLTQTWAVGPHTAAA